MVTFAGAGDIAGSILLVGDDPVLGKSIRETLGNYLLFEAGDNDAVGKALSGMPDVIISIVPNPVKEGYKCLQALKANRETNHIPVILVTGDASEEMRVEGLEAGAGDYLAAPFNEKELVVRVGNLVAIRKKEKELRRLNQRMIKFFPRKLVEWLLTSTHDIELSSEKKRLTVFFSDLSGFTELAEGTAPKKVMTMLNDYFTEMVKIVEHCGGTLDKFIGDGLMVFFGAPEAMDEKIQAVRAVSMAVAMQMRMKELSRKWKDEGVAQIISIRMGIHQDAMMVGNFGSRQVMEYTVFGSGVNLANRLESYCEPYKILVSYPVYSHTKGLFPYSEVVEQQFRGFERLVSVSELDPEKVSSLQTLPTIPAMPGALGGF
ncbi:MAG: response regulator [bacterium]|nr:response regulator [bacterium]